MVPNQRKRTAGSAIWSLALSQSGNRVLICTGYPDLSMIMVHGKGEVIFKTPLGSIAGVVEVNPQDLGAIIGLTARQGAGNILRVDGKGKQVWQCTTQRRIESMAIDHQRELFYIGTKEGNVLAMDTAGRRVWSKDFGLQRGTVNVRVSNDGVNAFTSRGYMYIIDFSGNVRFRSSTRVLFERVAVSKGMDILFSALSSPIAILGTAEGDMAWALRVHSPIQALEIAPDASRCFVGTKDGHLYCIKRNMKVAFIRSFPTGIVTMKLSDNGKYIAVATAEFKVYYMNVMGDLLWCMDLSGSQPELMGQCEDIRPVEGELTNLDLSAGKGGLDPAINNMLTALHKYTLGPTKKGLFAKEKKKKAEAVVEEEPEPEPDVEEEFMDSEEPKKAAKRSPAARPTKDVGSSISIKTKVSASETGLRYLVKLINSTPNDLEDIMIDAEVEGVSCEVTPSSREAEQLEQGSSLVAAFSIISTDDWRQLGDSWISSKVSFIPSDGGGLKEVTTPQVKLPLSMPELSFELVDEERLSECTGKPSIKGTVAMDLSIDLVQQELGSILEEMGMIVPGADEGGHEVSEEGEWTGVFLAQGDDGSVWIKVTSRGVEDGSEVICEVWGDPPMLMFVLAAHLKGHMTDLQALEEVVDESEDAEWADDDDEEEMEDVTVVELSDDEADWEDDDVGPVDTSRDGLEGVFVDNLEGGSTYLVEGATADPFAFVRREAERRRLVVSRGMPDRVMGKEGLDPMDTESVWLTTLNHDNAVEPTDLSGIRDQVIEFLENTQAGIVLIEGMEVLYSKNSFDEFLQLVQELRDVISLTDSSLVFVIDVDTLNEKEGTILLKEVDAVLAPIEEE